MPCVQPKSAPLAIQELSAIPKAIDSLQPPASTSNAIISRKKQPCRRKPRSKNVRIIT